MAMILSPSSPTPDDDIPTATLALPSIAAPSTSRRLPPPCWSPEETVSLIEAYRDKWYSLRRGNLRVNHWQDVAEDVANRCPVSPAKTSVQCRHKMEKLRKRYRSEIQRSAGVRRFISSWAHFQNMHAMEKGPNANPTPPSSSDEDDGLEDLNRGKQGNAFYNYNINGNQKGGFFNQGPVSNNGFPYGVRIKMPGQGTPVSAPVRAPYSNGQRPNNPYQKFATSSAGGGYGASSSKVMNDRFAERGDDMGKRGGEMKREIEDTSGVGEVAASIQALGEGFMRIEKMKMDMARKVEEMRMEMELKRTEMILESQQRIMEAFTEAVSESVNKKAKKIKASPQ